MAHQPLSYDDTDHLPREGSLIQDNEMSRISDQEGCHEQVESGLEGTAEPSSSLPKLGLGVRNRRCRHPPGSAMDFFTRSFAIRGLEQSGLRIRPVSVLLDRSIYIFQSFLPIRLVYFFGLVFPASCTVCSSCIGLVRLWKAFVRTRNPPQRSSSNNLGLQDQFRCKTS